MNKRSKIIIIPGMILFFSLSSIPSFSQNPSREPAKKEPVRKTEPDFTQVQNSCIDCHNSLEGQLKEPVRMWRSSVHGKVGTRCNICHGGNASSNNKQIAKSKDNNFIGVPKKGEILLFCGREGCHTTELKQFERGPHYTSVLKTGHPNCTSCHGAHNIQRSSPDIITEKTCASCHSLDYFKNILSTLTSLEKGVKDIRGNIDILLETHADVQELEIRVQRIRHLFRQLIHIFSTAEIQTTQKIVELEITNLLNESNSKVALTKRLDIIYYMTVIFASITIGGFIIYSLVMIYRRK